MDTLTQQPYFWPSAAQRIIEGCEVNIAPATEQALMTWLRALSPGDQVAHAVFFLQQEGEETSAIDHLLFLIDLVLSNVVELESDGTSFSVSRINPYSDDVVSREFIRRPIAYFNAIELSLPEVISTNIGDIQVIEAIEESLVSLASRKFISSTLGQEDSSLAFIIRPVFELAFKSRFGASA